MFLVSLINICIFIYYLHVQNKDLKSNTENDLNKTKWSSGEWSIRAEGSDWFDWWTGNSNSNKSTRYNLHTTRQTWLNQYTYSQTKTVSDTFNTSSSVYWF